MFIMNNITYDIKQALREHKQKSPLTFTKKLRILLFGRGLKALIAYRLHGNIKSLNIKGIWLVKWLLLATVNCMRFAIRSLYGIHIHPEAKIGGGFFISHFGGIYIGRCQIGENCAIAQQVCIGSFDNSSDGGPKIGHHVWIGPHSKIIGNVIIEDHVTIASGSVVTSDIRQGTLVMGNPSRTVQKNYDNTYLF
jgi:serine O-acetyltransferase